MHFQRCTRLYAKTEGEAAMQSFRAWFLEQMGMYAAYHRDRRNQATHHLGVPLIVFSLILALTQVPLTYLGSVQLTAATVTLAVLFLGYVVAAPLVGIVTALFYSAVYGLAVQLADDSDSSLWFITEAAPSLLDSAKDRLRRRLGAQGPCLPQLRLPVSLLRYCHRRGTQLQAHLQLPGSP